MVHFHEINISIWPISVPYATLDVDYCVYLNICVERLRIFICSSMGWCCIQLNTVILLKIIYDIKLMFHKASTSASMVSETDNGDVSCIVYTR